MLFSFVYGPALTYLCIIFKRKLRYPGHSDSPKSSNIVNSLLAYAASVEVRDNMALLQ